MPLTIEAVYENGVFKPKASVTLREAENVRLQIDRMEDSVFEVKLSSLAYPGPGLQTPTGQWQQTSAGSLPVTISLIQGSRVIAAWPVQLTLACANYTLPLSPHQIHQIMASGHSKLQVCITPGAQILSPPGTRRTVLYTATYTDPSTPQVWKWSSAVTVKVECWGGGGGGSGHNSSDGVGGGGGGGGGYAMVYWGAAANHPYNVVVGDYGRGSSGHLGGSGTSSSFADGTLILCESSFGTGGGGSKYCVGGSGDGGTSMGTTQYLGGTGGNSSPVNPSGSPCAANFGGGGGGGGAGSAGAGIDGNTSKTSSGAPGGSGGPGPSGSPDGGPGGKGGDTSGNGLDGTAPGGGGGGVVEPRVAVLAAMGHLGKWS
jgi:predicted DNA-binding antitoxin AbrB/MazE fold protein